MDPLDHYGPFWIVCTIFDGCGKFWTKRGPKMVQNGPNSPKPEISGRYFSGTPCMLRKDASDDDRPAALTLHTPATTNSLITSIIHLHNLNLNFVSDGPHPCWAGVLAGSCHCGLFKLCSGELSCRRRGGGALPRGGSGWIFFALEVKEGLLVVKRLSFVGDGR